MSSQASTLTKSSQEEEQDAPQLPSPVSTAKSHRTDDDDVEMTPTAPVGTEKDNFQAADPTFVDSEDLQASEVSLEKLKEWTLPDMKVIHVANLRWDMKQKWGQIRPANTNLSAYYKRRLEQSLPRQPVRVLVRDMGNGVFNNSTENLRKHSLYSQI